MAQNASPHSQRHKAAANQSSGGCLSLMVSPFYFLLLILAIFLMASGETTQPWDLTAEPAQIDAAGSEASSQQLSRVFTPEVLYWETNIIRWANEWGLEPNLVATVMQIESCGDPNALSSAGAMGLFQVMPYHFSDSDSPYSPETNARRGMNYLQQALQTYDGSIRLSLAGYNGGIGTAEKPQSEWPDETVRYVYWGTNIYQDAVSGKTSSATLDEWLSRGGASLCSQAHQSLGLP